jgi:hypothetical protein
VQINVVDRDSHNVMAAGLGGELRLSDDGCLYDFGRTARGPVRFDLVWPANTTVALDDSGVPVVVDRNGVVVAKVGQSLRGLGGGSDTPQHQGARLTCRVSRGSVFFIEGDMRPLHATGASAR